MRNNYLKQFAVILMAIALCVALLACAGGANRSGSEEPTKAPLTTGNGEPGGNTPGPDTDPTAPNDNAPTADQTPVEGSEGLKIKEYSDSCYVADIGTFSGTELIIPSHYNGKPVTSIDEDAITNNTMTSLVIPWTVVSIGEDAASESGNLETISFSEGLIGIGYGSFGSCGKLRSVSLPSTLERIDNSAFRNCAALEEVTLAGNADVGKSAFCDCPSLKKVTFAGNDKRAYSLLTSAFEGDTALETVVLSEGLGTIGSFAFANCASLGSVYIPASLTKIDASAFSNVGTLKIFYAGSEADWGKITVANGNDALKNAEIVYDYK